MVGIRCQVNPGHPMKHHTMRFPRAIGFTLLLVMTSKTKFDEAILLSNCPREVLVLSMLPIFFELGHLYVGYKELHKAL